MNGALPFIMERLRGRRRGHLASRSASQAAAHSAPSLASRPQGTFAAAGPSWQLVGIFPDPGTCTVAGITTGKPFFCGFYFFFWGLNVWQ